MTVTDLLVLGLGAVVVGAALAVVTTRHVVRAGLWLVVALGGLAGVYLVLTAELVAWVQMLVYVGAVVVLLLFAVMLTRAPIGPSDDLDRTRWPAALVGGGAGLGLLALLVHAYRWSTVDLDDVPPGTADQLGTEIFRAWVLPFEVLSVLLLAALIGAIVVSSGPSRTSGPTGPTGPVGAGRPAAPEGSAGVAPSAPSASAAPSGSAGGGAEPTGTGGG